MNTRAQRASMQATKKASGLNLAPHMVPTKGAPGPDDVVLRLLVSFPGESAVSSRAVQFRQRDTDALAQSLWRIACMVGGESWRGDLRLARQSAAWERLRRPMWAVFVGASAASMALGFVLRMVIR